MSYRVEALRTFLTRLAELLETDATLRSAAETVLGGANASTEARPADGVPSAGPSPTAPAAVAPTSVLAARTAQPPPALRPSEPSLPRSEALSKLNIGSAAPVVRPAYDRFDEVIDGKTDERMIDAARQCRKRADAEMDAAMEGSLLATAEAIELAIKVLRDPNSTFQDNAEVLQLCAEAQSSVRTALNGGRWEPQDEIHRWIKQEGQNRGTFIHRHMRLGDPADPKKHPELRKHIREFAERREKLKARAQESRAEPRLTDDEIDEDPDPLTLPSLDGVIADAEKRHAGKLFFALNSASETGLFKRADRAAKAFDFLAGTFRDAKRGTRKVPNLPLAAKEESGFEYVPHQSDTTVGMYERDYTAMHHGQTVYVTQHLRTGGNTRDPSRLLRIGFQYLEEEGVVLVGYIGPHQRNRST